jgi:hypothetical protein
MHQCLPSLLVIGIGVLAGCADDKPPAKPAAGLSDSHLQTLQNAEATRYQLEQRLLDQRRVDALNQRPPPR